MKIRTVIEMINQMQTDGVIDHYAIGGAVGATFYVEPVSTLDVDIFVALHVAPGSTFVSLDSIYRYLGERGCKMEGEYIVISGWPVQFIPPTGLLVEEALVNSIEIDVDGVPARVIGVDYLAAIALQTGRAKDKARLLQFVESGTLDKARLERLLECHRLSDKWREFQRQFLT